MKEISLLKTNHLAFLAVVFPLVLTHTVAPPWLPGWSNSYWWRGLFSQTLGVHPPVEGGDWARRGLPPERRDRAVPALPRLNIAHGRPSSA